MHSNAVGLGETPSKSCARESDNEERNERPLDESHKAPGDREYKRNDYICWDDYFMAIACLSAQRSKDPNTQVGACIIDSRKRIVGIGYNGMPNGCSDDELPWRRRHEDVLQTKYPYVCHAEMNAVMNRALAIDGCCMYVALFPCNECAKIIIQAGVKEVVYMRDKPEKKEMQASKRMLEMAGVKMRQFLPQTSRITIDFNVLEEGKDAAGRECTVSKRTPTPVLE